MATLLPPDLADFVAAVAATGHRLVLLTSGGGAAAIAQLATTPGASDILLEATVPSARAAVDGLLGGPQESYCSSRTARRLAVAAWERARLLAEAAGAAPEAAARQQDLKGLTRLRPLRQAGKQVSAVTLHQKSLR